VGSGNWTWQASSDALTDQVAATWKSLTEEFKR
jgi:hypothetical protein